MTHKQETDWSPQELREISDIAPWVKLYDGPDVTGEAMVEGQIVKPTRQSVVNFQNYYGGLLDPFCAAHASIRVLEIGAGMGNCSYGFIETYAPEFYIATEPFYDMQPTIRSNLTEWGYPYPKGIAAVYDANYLSILPQGAVNVVIGNSVLYHITHWRAFMSHAADLVGENGILLFGEPNHEAWSYIVTLMKAFRLAKPLSDETATRVSAFTKGLEFRFRHKDDSATLEKLEDKHLFSIKELSDFAAEKGMKLQLSKRKTDFKTVFCRKVATCIRSDKDQKHLTDFANEVIGDHVDQTVLGDPFMVFSLQK